MKYQNRKDSEGFSEEASKIDLGKVLAEFHTRGDGCTAEGRFILVRRQGYVHGQYVTWWQNLQNGGCNHGNYFDELKDARTDFLERCGQHYDKGPAPIEAPELAPTADDAVSA